MQRSSEPNINLQEKSIPSKTEIYYPESDGKPLAETDSHLSAIAYLRSALRLSFRYHPDIYTSACMLFYYAEGEPTCFTVPDIFIVRDVEKHERRTYKLWEEKVVPCAVFEITSNGTRWKDNGEKKELYQALGIKEYFLFDPLDEYLEPRLQGLRLQDGYYEPVSPAEDGTLMSQELDLMLRIDDTLLRVVNPITGLAVPTLEEAIDLMEALDRAQIEAQRADAAEAELERLRTELAQLKKQQTGQ